MDLMWVWNVVRGFKRTEVFEGTQMPMGGPSPTQEGEMTGGFFKVIDRIWTSGGVVGQKWAKVTSAGGGLAPFCDFRKEM